MEESPKGINEWEKASDEERWKMLNPDSGASKAENKPPEPKASEPESKNQYDSVFSARREAEEENKPAGKMPEPGLPAPKEAEPTITPRVSLEDRMAQIDARTQEIAKEIRSLDKSSADFRQKSEEYEFLRKEYNELSMKGGDAKTGEEKSPEPKIPAEPGKPGKEVVDLETIENFVPVEDRVRSLKENMVVGARNKDTEDFLNMTAEPYERVGKMKEDKNEKSLLERAKEVVSRGKEWIQKPSWIKERLKGFFTGCWWEVHQAEKFRVGKKKTGKELAEAAKQLQSMSGLLTYADALEVHNRLAAGGKLEEGNTKEKFEKMACEVRRERNLIYINQVLQQADQKLQERLKNYRDVSGKQVQLDPEKRRQLLGALGQKLVSMQDSPKTVDVKEFSKIIKDNLDPKYWKRYVYGGAEMAVWAAGAYWLNFAGGSATVAALNAPHGAESIAGGDAPMKDHIWGTVKQWLTEHGVSDPTDSQIMEGAKKVAKIGRASCRE